MPKFGLDITSVVGITLNTGSESRLEWTNTKKFENSNSVGIVGYVNRQLPADSGRGAALGMLKVEVATIGDSLGYDLKLDVTSIPARLRT